MADATPRPGCNFLTATSTDPAMRWHCQGWNVRHCYDAHIACKPKTLPSKGLVVFLPGTYLQPQDYSEIISEFAYHGFHALGVHYPSAEGQNGCGASRRRGAVDLNCTARERLRVLTGRNVSTHTNITAPDSITNRAAKALAALGAPWSTFLTAAGDVRWSDVILAGHSNGADHAGFLSKTFAVRRALLLAGPNDWVGARRSDQYYTPACVARSRCLDHGPTSDSPSSLPHRSPSGHVHIPLGVAGRGCTDHGLQMCIRAW
jgi:hypothetical protein